jgi:iron complex transport system substrate-binding protein
MTEPRIVSLLPSATEIVAALGFEAALVGRSHECDFPPGVEQLPVCTEPKVDPGGSTEEIHRRIQALLAESLSVYRVHTPRLKELSPTHVITQVQCEVCAVSLDDLEEALAGWTGTRPDLVALNPGSLANVFGDMQRVAAALGAPREGAKLVERLRRRMGAIAQAVSATDARPRVATIEWLSPLMAAGNWMPELIATAGGTNLFGEAGRHSSWLESEALSVADPDVILVFPCGFSLAQLEREIELLTSLPGWNALAAVRAGRVYLAEGNQYFNRPGPRLAETLEIVAEILHPDLFFFGHEGIAWKRLG